MSMITLIKYIFRSSSFLIFLLNKMHVGGWGMGVRALMASRSFHSSVVRMLYEATAAGKEICFPFQDGSFFHVG